MTQPPSREPAPVTDDQAERWQKLAEIAVSWLSEDPASPENAILRLLADRARAQARIVSLQEALAELVSADGHIKMTVDHKLCEQVEVLLAPEVPA